MAQHEPKTHEPGRYPCPGCYAAFDDYGEYDRHRIITHGRNGKGVLVNGDGSPYTYNATPTLEQRVARLEQLVQGLRDREDVSGRK
jgi:hypothetical protein